jgi:hypothetical protein
MSRAPGCEPRRRSSVQSRSIAINGAVTLDTGRALTLRCANSERCSDSDDYGRWLERGLTAIRVESLS